MAPVSLLRNAYIKDGVPAPCARIPAGCEVTWYRPACAGLHNSTLPTLYRAESLCVLCVFAELQDAVEEVLPTLKEQGITVYLLSDTCKTEGIKTLSEKISRASDEPLSPQLRANIHIRSTALYIYTSGTTGTEGGASITNPDKWKVSSDQQIHLSASLFHPDKSNPTSVQQCSFHKGGIGLESQFPISYQQNVVSYLEKWINDLNGFLQ